MSISGTGATPGLHGLLEPTQVAWFRRGSSGVSLIVPLARSLMDSQSALGSTWCSASSSARISSRDWSMNAVGTPTCRTTYSTAPSGISLWLRGNRPRSV